MSDAPIRAALEAATEAAFDVGDGSVFLPSCRRTTKSAIVAFLRALPRHGVHVPPPNQSPFGLTENYIDGKWLRALADAVKRAGAEADDAAKGLGQ